MLSAKKYLNTSHFFCFVYRQKKRLLRIYLLRVIVEKADRFEPSDKCERAKQLSLAFERNRKFVTSRESSGITSSTFEKEKKPMKHVY